MDSGGSTSGSSTPQCKSVDVELAAWFDENTAVVGTALQLKMTVVIDRNTATDRDAVDDTPRDSPRAHRGHLSQERGSRRSGTRNLPPGHPACKRRRSPQRQ
jgi:hypothetical protein